MLSHFSILVLCLGAHAAPAIKNVLLDTQIKTAPVNLQKFDFLKQAKEPWTFDFTAQQNYSFTPGSVVNANAASSPAMVGTGMTVAMLNLGPCAMLPPHLHPRATNVVTAVHGTTQTWMYNENGADIVSTTLTPGMLTIFPTGSLHGMMNMGCTNAQLVSALNSEDTGTLNILNGAALFSNDIVEAVFQGALTDQALSTLKSKIQPVGSGSQWGPEACYKACGIPYESGKASVWTFADAEKIWDGSTGTKEGYYDDAGGKAVKAGVVLPYSD